MKKFFLFSGILSICLANLGFSGCGIYGFSEKVTNDSGVKTIRVQMLTNEAPYRNPQLSPNLTDRLRQKINNQTKLNPTNSEKADLNISGYIKDYSVTTTGVTSTNGRSTTNINRLNVTVHILKQNQLKNTSEEFDVTRNFDFDANVPLRTAESKLLDEMVRNLADEIFNRLFSNW